MIDTARVLNPHIKIVQLPHILGFANVSVFDAHKYLHHNFSIYDCNSPYFAWPPMPHDKHAPPDAANGKKKSFIICTVVVVG